MFSWRERWESQAGYRDFLRIAFPLILSSGAATIQHFVDRVFLTWYSAESVAAALASGNVYWVVGGFVCGTAGYVNTFVAQYVGAGHPERVGPMLWQGIYFSILSGLLVIPLVIVAEPFFRWVGHSPEVVALETPYFRILCYCLVFYTANTVWSCFFTGRGETMTILWVNLVCTLVNMFFDWIMIFGKWGCPRMGIAGAGWATFISAVVNAILYLLLVCRKVHREKYAILSGWRLDPALFRRFMYYGLPSGVQLGLDVLSWALFVLLIGRIGTLELTITSIAFNINSLAFIPVLGCGITVSTLVGQYLGKNRPDLAARATWTGVHLSTSYIGLFVIAYLLLPDLFLEPFAWKADPQQFALIRPMGVVILQFVALYSLFDSLNVIFSGALKGAGDTRFVLYLTVGLGWLLMVVPILVFCGFYHFGLYAAWAFATLFIIALSFCFLVRFLGGKWRAMRVIEPEILPHLLPVIESPSTEVP
ncbi:MAG TPA: MATE family efflux transporter [bacterium]|nr:MATE family efflux transporter [bacterium]HQL63004.1 MATE family efflux transporter [bacterium]